MRELFGRIDFYIKKLSGRGWLMPNTVAVLKDAKAEIEKAYEAGFVDGQGNIVEGMPINHQLGFKQYQEDSE